MDTDFAAAVRAELVAIGTKESRLQRHQRRSRLALAGILALGIAAATTGAALVATHFPGSTVVTPVGALHSATHTGTGLLDLGPAPKGAKRVIVTIRCLSPQGSVSVTTVQSSPIDSGGAGTLYCSTDSMNAALNALAPGSGTATPAPGTTGSSITNHPLRADDAALPPEGSTAITITAGPDTRWAATAQYADSSVTPWGKNERGQTYGVCNVKGCPTLIRAQAMNGKIGFVYNAQETAELGKRHIPVYESDGTTVIGAYINGLSQDEGSK
ncbi:hypothetical protein GCM10022286_12960 [Gryllotalpicola daejeonensis]|uniref:Uncharacterized protein n=2 Tax=Gryllotalpicola daejeonensis TaxID=993087 RepID=A0ABP7ZID8_9MICO